MTRRATGRTAGAPAGRPGGRSGPWARASLPGVRPPLESEAGARGAGGSDPPPVRPRPYRVRGARPKLEVSRDVGGRAKSTAGDGDAGEWKEVETTGASRLLSG